MPIQSTNPIEVDGNIYPYFMINLSISPLVKETTVGGSVAMRLTPYRVLEDGTSESLGEDYQIPIVYMDVFDSGDTAALTATYAIMEAIQNFVINKNL
jgi:hypothetical protein